MTDQFPPAPGYVQLPPKDAYAHWGLRVAAALLDNVPVLVLSLISAIFNRGGNSGIILLLSALSGVYVVWNVLFRQGRTGQTIGKQQMKIALVREADGQPMGAWRCFLRQIAHILDSFFYIGYLWPLWDAKRQTFADKIMSTVVVPDAGRPRPL